MARVLRIPLSESAPIAESTFHRARRETAIWANNKGVRFNVVALAVAGVSSFACAPLFANRFWLVQLSGLIAVALLGWFGGLALMLGWEFAYKTPRRQRDEARDRVAALEAAESAARLPQKLIDKFARMVEKAGALEERWRNSVPVHSAVERADRDFGSWCDEVIELMHEAEANPFEVSSFKTMTAMRHEMNRYPGGNRLEDAADDMRQRREMVIHMVSAWSKEDD